MITELANKFCPGEKITDTFEWAGNTTIVLNCSGLEHCLDILNENAQEIFYQDCISKSSMSLYAEIEGGTLIKHYDDFRIKRGNDRIIISSEDCSFSIFFEEIAASYRIYFTVSRLTTWIFETEKGFMKVIL